MSWWKKIVPVEKVVEKEIERVVEQKLYYPKDALPVPLYCVYLKTWRARGYGGHDYKSAGFTLNVKEALKFIERSPKAGGYDRTEIQVVQAFKAKDGTVSTAAEFTACPLGLAWPKEEKKAA